MLKNIMTVKEYRTNVPEHTYFDDNSITSIIRRETFNRAVSEVENYIRKVAPGLGIARVISIVENDWDVKINISNNPNPSYFDIAKEVAKELDNASYLITFDKF